VKVALCVSAQGLQDKCITQLIGLPLHASSANCNRILQTTDVVSNVYRSTF